MRKATVKVTHRVPGGLYCNHHMRKSTHLTRCRFCTDLKKDGFVCVLYNEPLAVESGVLIQKTSDCLALKGTVESDDLPSIPISEVKSAAIMKYKKIYEQLLAQGFPSALADEYAIKEVIK